MTHRQPAVYILSSKRNGTLYVGVTSSLIKRVWEHKHDVAEGFSKRFDVHKLVYFEMCESMTSAIAREKQIKSWPRGRKLELIETQNPRWKDLWADILE